MKNILFSLFVSGALAMSAGALCAQDSHIQQRRDDQQQRIGNGVKNGSLTAGETQHLETREHGVNKEIRADRKANGGNLTNKEKAQVNRQQNRISGKIHQDKNNGAHPSQ
ncbi:MAG: hypothetical protein ABI165_07625 [Bryobacteraceae bacterium]